MSLDYFLKRVKRNIFNMKPLKILFLLMVMPLMTAATLHKYYVSVTEIEYVKEKKSVQIISRIFVDDLEAVLRKRYDKRLYLTPKKESKEVNAVLQRYFKEKFQIKINGESTDYTFIGKEYDNDIVFCYFEIKNIEHIDSFEVTNKLLFEMFDDQKNVVKTNINSQPQSFILISQNDKGLLNFD